MDEDDLRDLAQGIWAGVEYGPSSAARDTLRKALADAWDAGYDECDGNDGPNPYRLSASV